MSSADPSPAEGKAMTAEEAKRPLDEQLLRALSNNTYGTIAPWVLQDALAHLGRWRNRAFIAEEAADQFRADLDAERAAHQAAEARVRVLESALGKAADDVLAERRRQVEVEGWSAEHDDKHSGALARAAACYASHAGSCWAWDVERYATAKPPHTSDDAVLWPWDLDWWKPKNPRRDLVRAGALILAEIERLDRLSPQEEGNG